MCYSVVQYVLVFQTVPQSPNSKFSRCVRVFQSTATAAVVATAAAATPIATWKIHSLFCIESISALIRYSPNNITHDVMCITQQIYTEKQREKKHRTVVGDRQTHNNQCAVFLFIRSFSLFRYVYIRICCTYPLIQRIR